MNVREWALPVYTVLTQIASGGLLVLWIIRSYNNSRYGQKVMDQITKIPVLIIFFTTIIAMVGAHFHLSRPWLSLLAMSNFRSSWLSREIISTLLFFLFVGCLLFLQWFVVGRERLATIIGWLAVLFGLTTVYCMARIYLLPTQAAWNSPLTILIYFIGMIFLGISAMLAIMLLDMNYTEVWKPSDLGSRPEILRKALAGMVIICSVTFFVIVVLNIYQLALLRTGDPWAQTSFALMIELYLPLFVIRLSLPLIGVILLVVCSFQVVKNKRTINKLTIPAYSSCLLILIGEVTERFLFYATHIRIGI